MTFEAGLEDELSDPVESNAVTAKYHVPADRPSTTNAEMPGLSIVAEFAKLLSTVPQ